MFCFMRRSDVLEALSMQCLMITNQIIWADLSKDIFLQRFTFFSFPIVVIQQGCVILVEFLNLVVDYTTYRICLLVFHAYFRFGSGRVNSKSSLQGYRIPAGLEPYAGDKTGEDACENMQKKTRGKIDQIRQLFIIIQNPNLNIRHIFLFVLKVLNINNKEKKYRQRRRQEETTA